MLVQVKDKSKLFAVFLLIGITVGIIIIVFSRLQLEWLLYCYFGLFFGILSLLVTDKKRYFQFLLITTISVGRPFLVGAPFSIHRGGAQDVPDFFMADIWLFVLLFIWIGSIFNKKRSMKFNIQAIDIAFLLLILWSFFSVMHARNYEYGFYELIRMMKQFLLYFYISRNMTTKDDVKYIVFFLMVALCVQSFIAIYQYIGGQLPFGFFNEVDVELSTTGARRVGGTLFNCTTLSQFLELIIPISLALALYHRDKRWQSLCWLVASVGIIALIFTFTRGAILSFGFTIFLILMLQSILNSDKKNHSYSVLMRVLVITLLIFSFFIVFKDEILLRFGPEGQRSAMSRIYMNKVALVMIRENPVFGIGLNNFNEVMNFYGMSVLLSSPVDVVHNVYLFFTSEIGIPGLLTLFFIIGMIYVKTYHIVKQNKDSLKAITVGIMSGMTSYLLIHSNVTHGFKNLMPIGYLFWLLVGLIVAIEKITTEQNEYQRK